MCCNYDYHVNMILILLQVVRMVVSTYQAASGAGAAAMEELVLQTREVSSISEIPCVEFSNFGSLLY